ncbi:MAG: conjugative transfer system coupling protein TraD [Rhodanobacter sp.]
MNGIATDGVYASPFRPLYERTAACVWAVAGVVGLLLAGLGYAGTWAPLGVGILGVTLATRWGRDWWKAKRRLDRFTTIKQTPLPMNDFRPLLDEEGKRTFIGWGFEWNQAEAQLAREVVREDPSRLKVGYAKGKDWMDDGQAWLHGLSDKEMPLYMKVADEHTLLVALSGWGKTFFYRLLIAQAVNRGEAVIVIDPKGDDGMRNAVREAAAWAGKEMLELNAAFPARSIRLDPLKNWDDPSELATRISTLIGKSGRADNFTAFVFMQLVNVINGMLLIKKRPSLVALKQYFDSGLEELLAQAITAYCNRELEPSWHAAVDRHRRAVIGRRKVKPDDPNNLSLTPEEEAQALTQFYRAYVRAIRPNPELEGLIATVEHPHEHWQKMIATLMPVLTKLTSGPLASLLSTDGTARDDARVITDTARIVEEQSVVFIGLNALGNEEVANAVGEIILADLAAVCGSRYNYADKDRQKVVSIFVDEAVEVLNDKLILLMNKGRGAQFRLNLATQTISDFESRLGSAALAEKVLGNVTNIFAGRLTADISQKYFVTKSPQVSIASMQLGRALSASTLDPMEFSANQTEKLALEDDYAIKESYLACLPKFNYFAMLGGSRFVKGRIPILL